MKIGLIIPANRKYAPYVEYYIRVLSEREIDYSIILWNKAGIDEGADFSFDFCCEDTNRLKMLIGHWLFSRRCKKIISNQKYDKLIIFTIAPLYFLGFRLLKKYRNRLLIDIRDDSPFRRRMGGILKKYCALASDVVVSSPFFSAWTNRTTVLCHNADVELINKYYKTDVKKKFSSPMSIVFAGTMIEPEINIDVIEKVKNSNNITLGFIGKSNVYKDRIEQYVSQNSINNVWFEGIYQKQEIVYKYQSRADLVNVFRKNTLINRNALPNKLYDAVVSGVPLIVLEHNEAIFDYVRKYDLGLILNETEFDDIENAVLLKAAQFDFSAYEQGRERFLDSVVNDMARFEACLIEFLSDK